MVPKEGKEICLITAAGLLLESLFPSLVEEDDEAVLLLEPVFGSSLYSNFSPKSEKKILFSPAVSFQKKIIFLFKEFSRQR